MHLNLRWFRGESYFIPEGFLLALSEYTEGEGKVRKSTIYLFNMGLAIVILTTLASVGVYAQRCDPMKQEQADLSGTYTGKVRHGQEPAVDATLTITGNNFTMTAGSETNSGRITAVTTCGYTGVTMMMGDLTPPPASPNPPAALPAMSLRAKKVGNSLTLTSVPGEPKQVWFSTGGGGGKPKARKHKAKAKTDTMAPAKTTP